MCRNFMEFLGVTRSAYLEGENGFHDLYIGFPVKLGQNVIEEIIQITLTDDEQKALQKSADAVKDLVAVLKKPK